MPLASVPFRRNSIPGGWKMAHGFETEISSTGVESITLAGTPVPSDGHEGRRSWCPFTAQKALFLTGRRQLGLLARFFRLGVGSLGGGHEFLGRDGSASILRGPGGARFCNGGLRARARRRGRAGGMRSIRRGNREHLLRKSHLGVWREQLTHLPCRSPVRGRRVSAGVLLP